MDRSLLNQGQAGACSSTWIDESTWVNLSTKKSDFVPYLEQKWPYVDRTKSKNVNMRMVEMLKRTVEARVQQTEKSFKHIVRERLRRQSHREGYMGLRAILPFRTKCDKISITTAATTEIIKTRRMLEELKMRNRELKEQFAACNQKAGPSQGIDSTVRIRVEDPTSGIDSMAEVLHCLENLGSKLRKMRSHFSDKEFSAELEINSLIAWDEVEKSVEKTLMEVEEKLLRKR